MSFLSKAEDPYYTILKTRVPKPINPEAAKSIPVFEAFAEMRRAEKALKKAKEKVPSYTGQWSDEDYYAEEQETYNRAVEAAAEWLARIAYAGSNWPNPRPVTEPSPFQTAMSQKIEDAIPTMTAKDRKYCEGLVYLGDIVTKIDSVTSSYNQPMSFPSMDVIRAIPARQGLEDWVRPEEATDGK